MPAIFLFFQEILPEAVSSVKETLPKSLSFRNEQSGQLDNAQKMEKIITVNMRHEIRTETIQTTYCLSRKDKKLFDDK
jgi:hypothetical protein